MTEYPEIVLFTSDPGKTPVIKLTARNGIYDGCYYSCFKLYIKGVEMFQTMYFDQIAKRFEEAKRTAFKKEFEAASDEVTLHYKEGG